VRAPRRRGNCRRCTALPFSSGSDLFSPRDPLPDVGQFAPLSPLDAYREDLRRHPNIADFGPNEAIWLIVACGIHRLAQLTGHERAKAAAAFGESLEEIRKDGTQIESDTPSNVPVVTQLEGLQDGLRSYAVSGVADRLLENSRTMAIDIEGSGALLLARSLIVSAMRLAPESAWTQQGFCFAQLGRIARTLSDFATAEQYYDAAATIGATHGVPEVEAWAAMGKAVSAIRKGNYPRGRELFQRGLAIAEANGLTDLVRSGHQGLGVAAYKAGDYESALKHEWLVFEDTEDSPTRRARALGNVSQTFLEMGYPQAAMRGFHAALALSNVTRSRLPFLGGAVVAAVRLGDRELMRSIAEAIDRESSPTFPYETGQALVGLAQAYAELGEETKLREVLGKARRLAKQGGFFELMHSVDQIESKMAQLKPSRPKRLSDDSADVMRSVEALPWEERWLDPEVQHSHG
jgi:tetratricopeptide (TPR) repeat protein